MIFVLNITKRTSEDTQDAKFSGHLFHALWRIRLETARSCSYHKVGRGVLLSHRISVYADYPGRCPSRKQRHDIVLGHDRCYLPPKERISGAPANASLPSVSRATAA